MTRITSLTLGWFVVIVGPLAGGDAVAIGYNSEGVWTSVTYYRSSTPPGGSDYKDEQQARDEALRDLRRRGGEQLREAKILSASTATGYVAIGRGKHRNGKDENVVRRGQSQDEADNAALAQLNRLDAARKRQIIYRYFSYGADSKK